MVAKYRLALSRYQDIKGQGLSRKTQGFYAVALRSFLKWCIKRDIVTLAPEKIDLPKIEDRQIKFLVGEDVDRLLNCPSINKLAGLRDKAILEMLFSTGLRVSEIVKIKREEIDFDHRELGIVGKGGHARVVFISTRAAEWVKKYLELRRDSHPALFPITPRSIQRMIHKYAKKLKLPMEVTPHVLRHSFASDLLIAGADIRSVQEMLGHKNIQTTQIYTHVTHRHLKEIHDEFHGKG